MRAAGRPPLLPPGWIVFALYPLYPVSWALGISGFVWSLAALPVVVWVLLRRDLARPPATVLYAIYILWALFSVVRLDTLIRVLTFGMRYAAYVAALGLAYYVYNERRVSRQTFINWVAVLWVVAIAGGYLGLLVPNGRLSFTPASFVLPGSIASNDFVGNLVKPRFAQVQDIFGVAIPRPAAPFAFTNEWGANVGLLTPFFVAATLYSRDVKRQRLGIIGLLVGLPPMILSVNRGLWISGAVILTIVAVRSFVLGRTAPLKFLGASIIVVVGLVALTPIGGVVSGRLSESSANSREGIYREAWSGALESPLLGWGGPRPSANPFSPAVGTHGHFWFAMFSHGLVGLLLYISWLVSAMYQSARQRDPVSVVLASVVFVAAVQMFFYKMLPVELPTILIALALVFRRDDDHLRPVGVGVQRASEPSGAPSGVVIA